MHLIMAGGGTGGHLFPGLALARQLTKDRPEIEISFVGTAHGLDLEIVPRAGYPIDILAAGRGNPLNWRKPLDAPRFAVSILQSVNILRRYRPRAVIALGGFAAAAPGIAARLCRVPLIILEQNTLPGRVNRMLSKWAKQIYLQFRTARQHFPATFAKFYDFGSPLRETMFTLSQEKPCHGKALLIIGGSQGATKLNEITAQAMAKIIAQLNCPVIHIAGAGNETALQQYYQEQHLSVEVLGFFGAVEQCLRRARLVISRSGAGSIAELTAAGLPSILVPLPTSADNHQLYNANWLSEQGASITLEQPFLTPEKLADETIALWQNESRCEQMSNAARRAARPNAAQEIASSIISFLDNGAQK